MTPQKYGYMANEEPSTREIKCEVCGNPGPWSWTDRSGEAYCFHCGSPHQLKWGEVGCNLKKEWIPIIREYWETTGRGCGCGSFMIEHDYPDQIRNRADFGAWVDENNKGPGGDK